MKTFGQRVKKAWKNINEIKPKKKEIKIGTESVTNEEGGTSNVSSIEIILTTKKKNK